MKKKTAVIISIVLTLIGSAVTFYAMNLLLSDLANMFYGAHDVYFISSIPMFIVALYFDVALIFTVRYMRYPQFKHAMINLYTTIFAVLSVIGIVFSILTGTIIYHSFIAPYPFLSYGLIMLIINIIVLAISIFMKCWCRRNVEKDKEKRHFKVKYIVYSAVLVFFVYFAFNKFGALLFASAYAQGSTLYLTFPFYLTLLLPMALAVHVILYYFNFYVGKEKKGIINVSIILVMNLVLHTAVFIIGYRNTSFIAAVSPALALERLATFPIDTIFQVAVMTILCIYYLIYAVITYKRRNRS